jgi:hypothetical protein
MLAAGSTGQDWLTKQSLETLPVDYDAAMAILMRDGLFLARFSSGIIAFLDWERGRPRSMHMDELRAAVRALAAEAQRMERQLDSCQEPPLKSELEALQKSVDGIQQVLNRLQTAMDVWSEETESSIWSKRHERCSLERAMRWQSRMTSRVEWHSRKKRAAISSSTVSPGRSEGGPDMKKTSALSNRFGSLRDHSIRRQRNMPSQTFAMTMPEGAMVTTIRSPLVIG